MDAMLGLLLPLKHQILIFILVLWVCRLCSLHFNGGVFSGIGDPSYRTFLHIFAIPVTLRVLSLELVRSCLHASLTGFASASDKWQGKLLSALVIVRVVVWHGYASHRETRVRRLDLGSLMSHFVGD